MLNDASKTLARQRDKGPRVCTVAAPPRKARQSSEKRAQARQDFANAVFKAMEREIPPEQFDEAVQEILAAEAQGNFVPPRRVERSPPARGSGQSTKLSKKKTKTNTKTKPK